MKRSPRNRLRGRLFRIALGLVVAGGALPRPAHGEPQVAAEKIEQSIEKARAWLLKKQQRDGSWECVMRTNETRVGATALTVLALANAGVEVTDPAMAKSLAWLRKQEPKDTYSVSLQTMVFAMLSPDADRPIIARNVEWLEKAQVSQGRSAGSWSYGADAGTGDNSNSQFALLGLHEASRAGVPVKEIVWTRAQHYWVACANGDGSWGYTLGNAGGSGSMTCAGIASIWITTEHLGRPGAQVHGDSVSCCGGGSSPQQLERGLEWLGRRFSVTQNPATGGQTWLYYYLYGLERVGRFTARRFIGDHDWYREGAAMFVTAQNPLTGAFEGGRIEDSTVATSFALLFLAKGRRPVVVAKSRHTPGPDWSRHGHDIAHLVEHVEKRWRKQYPAGLSWHVLDTPAAKADDFAQAPVLWLSGKNGFDLGQDAGRRLRHYLDEGGFIFAEGCCPSSNDFDARFRQLVEEIFPEPEYRLHLLPPEHPAWHAEEIVPPELQRPLLGVDYGCRTSIIYAPPTDLKPNASPMPSLSCLWEIGGESRKSLPPSIQREVDAALAIGANVLAYATNRELKSKDELFAIERPAEQPADPLARGQLAIGKLRHGGLCDAAPSALPNILRAAARELGVRVDDTPRQIDPADPALFTYHLVFMHGRQGFSFTAAQRERLRQFIERGGTLLSDSVCAARGFTTAFRSEMAALFPDHALEEIPRTDPMFAAADYGGFDIREVTLREPAGGDGPMAARKRRIPPKLEGIRIGDRWAVIFSPYDISCALEKQNSMECTGYDRDDAEKIALNVLLYSLNQ
ncbi:MAG: DUF4159 domain-containing protein [Planctomycetia bacterium]